MEFDKSKVFTTFNADEVKVGSKGYIADTKETLIAHVQSENENFFLPLLDIKNEEMAFVVANGVRFRYFYLVEEPKEKKKRPCTKKELLAMLQQQGLPMLKGAFNEVIYTVLCITEQYVVINSAFDYGETMESTLQSTCKNYTLIDRTELWVEE